MVLLGDEGGCFRHLNEDLAVILNDKWLVLLLSVQVDNLFLEKIRDEVLEPIVPRGPAHVIEQCSSFHPEEVTQRDRHKFYLVEVSQVKCLLQLYL